MLKEKRFCKILKKILEDFEPKATHKNNTNMKKEYMKPEQRVVELQHKTHLLQASQASTNLAPEDDLDITDTPSNVWGR